MAKRTTKGDEFDDEVTTEEVNSPRVKAGPCPRNPNHEGPRVYSTKGRTRFCVCDSCGKKWKRIGPEAGSDDEPKTIVDPLS